MAPVVLESMERSDKERDFWTMAEGRDTSWCWRYILRSRDKARQLSFHLLGDGRATRFWEDKWHPLGVLADRFPGSLRYDSLACRGVKVSNFIDTNGWNFPPHIIPHVRDIADSVTSSFS